MNRFYYKSLLAVLVLIGSVSASEAQVWKKIIPDKEPLPLINDEDGSFILKQIQEDVSSLASSKMQGRLTGTPGEANAGMYVEKRMADIGLAPFGKDRSFRKQFRFVSGRQLTPETRFNIGSNLVSVTEEAFPASFSAAATEESYMLPDSREPNGPWLISLYESAQEAARSNFDWKARAYELSRYALARGATSVLLYDAYVTKNAQVYSSQTELPALTIPVMFINKKSYEQYVKQMSVIQSVYLKVAYRNDYLKGTNI